LLSNSKELVEWIDAREEKPDEEQTVLLFCPDANEPVWPGYLDDGQWRWVSGGLVTDFVVAWAEMLRGPKANINVSQGAAQ